MISRAGCSATQTPTASAPGSAPAEEFFVDGGPATVGVVGSVSRPFCGACDRLRLTADGQVRNCLFATEESDLQAPLRAGASDDELVADPDLVMPVGLIDFEGDPALGEQEVNRSTPSGHGALALRAAVAGKKKGHGIGDPGFVQPDRPMSAIGG